MTDEGKTDWLGLAGQRVLVAGAGGIGAACAGAFLEVGAQVGIVDVAAERLAAVDNRMLRLTEDVSTVEGCEHAVRRTVDEFGGLDVLIHAVGVNHRVPVLDLQDRDWQRILDINLSSAFRLGRAAGRLMVGAGHVRQVYLSSVSGLLAHPEHAPYAASKGGLDQLVGVMAREWAASGVTVNAVAPEYTETDLTREQR
jgi:gluconate 5-dehydrogenase